MSWLARSIVNSLKFDDVGDNQSGSVTPDDATSLPGESLPADNSQSVPLHPDGEDVARGVKEDISELTKSLSRQFWGVASFLAPPPVQNNTLDNETDQVVDREEEDADLMRGIRSDFEEIGGKFKSGISKLSANIAVSEISKMATNFLQFSSDDQDAIGVTEEVLIFARDLSQHPETWLDFPVPENGTFDEFEMSDAQQEHALAVERLVPGLAALRIDLCPGYMSEACFWSIYFVLIHPRLSKEDAMLLSSPNIFEARASLSQGLKKRPMAMPGTGGVPEVGSDRADFSQELFPEDKTLQSFSLSVAQVLDTKLQAQDWKPSDSSGTTGIETEKHTVQCNQMSIVDKNVVEEQSTNSMKTYPMPSSSSLHTCSVDDETDNWLKEEIAEASDDAVAEIPLGNDEDVSFSDLEDDDADIPTSYKTIIATSNDNAKAIAPSLDNETV